MIAGNGDGGTKGLRDWGTRSTRRFTRLTNGPRKKLTSHETAIALRYMHHNFCRIHQTLRVTLAMEAGLADRVWTMEELVGLFVLTKTWSDRG
jgi:hypothetical protein